MEDCGPLGMDALPRLLGKATASFVRETYRRSYRVFPAAITKEDRSGLFSAATVDRSIASGGIRTSSVRVVRNGQELPAEKLGSRGAGDSRSAEPYVDSTALANALSEGYTVVLRSLHRISRDLGRFAADLSAELGHPVRVFAYITPASSQGLKLHYDTHDVFVVQISGRKEWVVHETDFKQPLEAQGWHLIGANRRKELQESSTRVAQVVLGPGDVLYMPRGYLHAAQAIDEVSIHLAISVHPVTRHRLLEELLARVAEEEWFREDVPLGLGEESISAVHTALADGAHRLVHAAESIDSASVAWSAGQTAWSDAVSTPTGVVELIRAIEDPGQVGAFRVRPGAQWFTDDVESDRIVLYLPDRKIQLPKELGHAVNRLLSGEPLPYRETSELARNSTDELLRALLKSGLLEPLSN